MGFCAVDSARSALAARMTAGGRHLTGREHAPHYHAVHLVFPFDQFAVSIAKMDGEHRKHTFSPEILFGYQERQLAIESLAIRRLIAIASCVPGENTKLVKIK